MDQQGIGDPSIFQRDFKTWEVFHEQECGKTFSTGLFPPDFAAKNSMHTDRDSHALTINAKQLDCKTKKLNYVMVTHV
jgi:hypothetical protein